MSAISVVVNTRNEEKNLPRALRSVKKIADEVIVVDMHSEDRTRQIARQFGAKVYLHPPTGYVEPARNYAIAKATKDWVLLLDADEEIPSALAQKLTAITKSNATADYYRLPRKNIIFGKWIKHSRWWPDYNIRFFRKGTVVWSEIIHAVPETKGTGIDLKPTLSNAIVHHHYDSVEQYLERMNRYTTEHAKILVKNGYRFRWEDLIQKPVAEFLSRYFAGQGYKDGLHGLALSMLQAFSELSLYLKVWQMTKFSAEEIHLQKAINLMKRAEKDLHYWQSDALFREKGGIIQRIKRKLRI